MFKIVALLESVRNLLHNPYNTTHLTLGMLLHYLGKLKIQIFCRCGRKRNQIGRPSRWALAHISSLGLMCNIEVTDDGEALEYDKC